jgi:gluconokinase
VAATAVVVMGVSGSGKTTVAVDLARRLGWEFTEGDEHHPPANVEKMRAGIPLDDADREPWLRGLARWIGERERAGASCVLTCSALERSYRDLLREGNDSVWFAHVDVPEAVLAERLAERTGHYMPASLLGSQLAILEPLDEDEPGLTVPGTGAPGEVVDAVVAALERERGLDP